MVKNKGSNKDQKYSMIEYSKGKSDFLKVIVKSITYRR